jgi:hypothetical protein
MFYICCSRCKKSLPKSAAFCRRCGLEVSQWNVQQMVVAMRPGSGRNPKPSTSGTGLAAAALFAIGIAIVSLVMSHSSGTSFRPADSRIPSQTPSDSPVSYGAPPQSYSPYPSAPSPYPQMGPGSDAMERLREVEAINRFNRENQQRMWNPPGAYHPPVGGPPSPVPSMPSVPQPGAPGPHGY